MKDGEAEISEIGEHPAIKTLSFIEERDEREVSYQTVYVSKRLSAAEVYVIIYAPGLENPIKAINLSYYSVKFLT